MCVKCDPPRRCSSFEHAKHYKLLVAPRSSTGGWGLEFFSFFVFFISRQRRRRGETPVQHVSVFDSPAASFHAIFTKQSPRTTRTLDPTAPVPVALIKEHVMLVQCLPPAPVDARERPEFTSMNTHISKNGFICLR